MKIGNLEFSSSVFLAPMAGITDPPYRRTVQRFGVSALWTEMMSSHGLVLGRKKSETTSLEGHRVPTVFQIHGNAPRIMAEAAAVVQDLGAAMVDINMGCPVKKVVRKGSGAALMNNMPLAREIVAAVRKAVNTPITVKIRSGWDEKNRNAPEMAALIESEGADAIVVHCRSRSRFHSGPPDMEVLEQVKDRVSIPVIGNGGIKNPRDATRMMARTACDGIMVGRGALGRPWLPGRILAALEGWPTTSGKPIGFFEVIRDHYRCQLEIRDVLSAVRRMRKHLAWYSRGFQDSAEFRKTVFRMDDPVRVLESVERFFDGVVVS